jgi:hypothetical protein
MMSMINRNGFDDSHMVISAIAVNSIYFFILLLAAAKSFNEQLKALDQVDRPETPVP